MIADSTDIFAAFQSQGFLPQSMISRDQLRTIMNQLFITHNQGKTLIASIPLEIQSQLWQKTTGNQNGEVILADYVLTLEKAQDMLLQKIQATQVSKRQNSEEINTVRNSIERARLENNDQEAQRLMDGLRYLSLNSQKLDTQLLSYKDDLKLITIPFGKGGHTIFKEVKTTVQTVEVIAMDDGIHNRSIQNISANNALNNSFNRGANILNTSYRSGRQQNKSILDTSAQKARNNISMNSYEQRAPSLTPQPQAPFLIEENIVTTTINQSPYHNSILHRGMSPRPEQQLGPQYQNSRLYFIFWLSVALFFFQLFQMIEKPFMLGLLTSLLTIGMFVLQRFNASNVKAMMWSIFISIVFDIVWIILALRTYLTKDCRDVECEFEVFQAQHKWPYEIEHRGLHITIVVMVFLCLFLKVIVEMLLFSFRIDSYIQNERCIRLFEHELIINEQLHPTHAQSFGYVQSN